MMISADTDIMVTQCGRVMGRLPRTLVIRAEHVFTAQLGFVEGTNIIPTLTSTKIRS